MIPGWLRTIEDFQAMGNNNNILLAGQMVIIHFFFVYFYLIYFYVAWTASSLLTDNVHGKLFGDALVSVIF
jgi:hypothetical protein